MDDAEITGLVERLRGWIDFVEAGYEVPAAGRAMREAVDALTALAAERDAFRAEVERMHAEAIERAKMAPPAPLVIRNPESLAAERDALAAQVAELREAIRVVIEEGAPPVEPVKPYRLDGKSSKLDRCAHGNALYEGCGECVDAYLGAALATPAADALAALAAENAALAAERDAFAAEVGRLREAMQAAYDDWASHSDSSVGSILRHALALTPSAALARVRNAVREEAAARAYSMPDYAEFGPNGFVTDANGRVMPGSPYDRGRYDAAAAIRAAYRRDPETVLRFLQEPEE